MIACFTSLMIICFAVIIYVLIQNRRLDAKIAELMRISQSGHRITRMTETASVHQGPSRPVLRTPASYPSFSNYDLTFPDPSWETVEAPSELPSQPNRIYSSVTFPRTRVPSMTHRHSFSNAQPHGTLEQLAQHYESLGLDEPTRPPTRMHEAARQAQEPEHDRLGELSGSPPRVNRLDIWPPRSRLSSLIRQSHPHIILSTVSLNHRASTDGNDDSLSPTTSFLPAARRQRGIR